MSSAVEPLRSLMSRFAPRSPMKRTSSFMSMRAAACSEDWPLLFTALMLAPASSSIFAISMHCFSLRKRPRVSVMAQLEPATTSSGVRLRLLARSTLAPRDSSSLAAGTSQALAAIAYVKGVGGAARDAPRANLTGDPYFTDGLRLVLFISDTPIDVAEVDYLAWEEPADR